ncbi:MAG: site-specific integrase [Desulfuromonadales bacterium]|nr:site-specific integrase [Desulfuromonadales bacterium]
MATIQERQSSDGKTKYRVIVRLKGCSPHTATSERKTDAKKWAQDTESAIRDGRHFKTVEAKKHTLQEMVDRYVENVLPLKPKTYKNQKMQLEWWADALGYNLLSDVTPALIAECRDKLLAGTTYRGTKRSPATVVRYLAAISHVFTVAVNEWGWIEHSPVSKVKKPTEARGRIRFLADDERAALLDACKESVNPFLYVIVVLAITTGMRQGEILKLKWKDVDLVRSCAVLHETKNGERRTVPIPQFAAQFLIELSKVRRIDTPLVFPGKKDPKKPIDIRNMWDDAVEKAKLEDFRFHDLRHTAASYLAMNGATLAEIAEVLGHKTLQMVKRYAHLSDAHTAGVVERMSNKIFG